MIKFITSRVRAFGYAFRGWWYVLRTQKNAWIHALITLAVAILALGLKLPPHDLAALVLIIAIVWIAEFINTALEAVVDLAIPHQRFSQCELALKNLQRPIT